MKNYVVIFFCLTYSIFAQFDITIQDSFEVVVNDSSADLNQLWYDSLKSEANQSKIYYQISGYETSKHASTAKIKIPQTLTLKQIMRQVIFYYSMLSDEKEREKEKLLLYPFFTDISEPEYLNCSYSKNTYYFQLKKWKTIPTPSQPTPEEKFIYNQIMKSAMQNTLDFEELPEGAIKEASLFHNKPINEIYEIYKKVALWNACR